jgi:dihydrofolate reductase
MRLELVVARARNDVIGRQGELPWRLPDDLALFKAITLGHPVLMGRKTHESIGRPLPGRRNVVLSRDPGFAPPGVDVVRNLEAALAELAGADRVFVIGGEDVFRATLPLAATIHLTEVDAEVPGDAYFPAFDRGQFREVERIHHPADERHAHAFDYVRLERAPSR